MIGFFVRSGGRGEAMAGIENGGVGRLQSRRIFEMPMEQRRPGGRDFLQVRGEREVMRNRGI